MEFRIKDCQLQADESGSLKVGGYINVTERESEMLYNKKNGKWFKEVMKKGVFKRAIQKATTNIPLLFEHDWNRQLASVDEGSLILKEDNIGLRFDAVIKDESIYQQVKAGVINSCSFGFKALAEEVNSINSRLEKRIVSAIELMEVSLVKNPAYVGSLCETRSYEEELKEEERANCDTDEKQERESLDEEIEKEKLEGESENENSEDTEEDAVEEKKEEEALAEEKEESNQDESEEADKRFNEIGEVPTEEEQTLVEIQPELDKSYIAEIVEELINEKMNQIKRAEEIEVAMNQETERAKEFHREIERELESNSIAQSSEILKLRVQLLKLKEIKRGI